LKSGRLAIIKKSLARFSLTDIMLVLGAGLLFYGIYGYDPRLAFIFGGLVLIGWSVWIEYNKSHNQPLQK
jgi:hypothetical protein